MKTQVLDIETAPDTFKALSLLPPFNPDDVKLGNLKDEAKIAAKIEEAKSTYESDWIADSALCAERGNVVAAGILTKDASGEIDGIWDAGKYSEKDILTSAWDTIWTSIRDGDLIIGHNILQFDLCFMVRRSWILGIDIPSNVRTVYRGRRYWAENFIDTRTVWQLDQRDYKSSLGYVAQSLGAGEKTGSGKDFAELLKTDRDAALAYLRNDLRATLGIATKMNLVQFTR